MKFLKIAFITFVIALCIAEAFARPNKIAEEEDAITESEENDTGLQDELGSQPRIFKKLKYHLKPKLGRYNVGHRPFYAGYAAAPLFPYYAPQRPFYYGGGGIVAYPAVAPNYIY